MNQMFSTAIAIAAMAGAIAASQAAAVAGQSARARVFTAEQAASGKASFATACASCHLADLTGNDDAPALAGPQFQALWKGRSTKELLDYMAGAMPPGGSTLDSDDYAAIVAFILDRNGAPAGSESLTPATAVQIGSITMARGD